MSQPIEVTLSLENGAEHKVTLPILWRGIDSRKIRIAGIEDGRYIFVHPDREPLLYDTKKSRFENINFGGVMRADMATVD